MFGHRWIRREFEDWQPTQHQRLQRGRRQQQQWSASFCACLSKKRIVKQKTDRVAVRRGGAGRGASTGRKGAISSRHLSYCQQWHTYAFSSKQDTPRNRSFFSRHTQFKFMTRSWQHPAKGREGRTGGGRSGPAQLVHPSSRSQSDVGEGMERESGLQLTNP